MAKHGRPTKYRKEHLQIARLAAQAGFTDEEIAKELEIDTVTFYRWKASNDAFCKAVARNKEKVDSRVQNALLKRALGYEEEAVQIFCDRFGKIHQVPYIKKIAPDPKAAEFWLRNRKAAEWKANPVDEAADQQKLEALVSAIRDAINPPGDEQ